MNAKDLTCGSLPSQSIAFPIISLEYPIKDKNFLALEQVYNQQVCTFLPTTDGVFVRNIPYRLPLDELAMDLTNKDQHYIDYLLSTLINTSCSYLSQTDSLSQYSVFITSNTIPFQDSSCEILVSNCVRTRADPSLRRNCCLNQWPYGSSLSTSLSRMVVYPTNSVTALVAGHLYTNTSYQVNPFELCEPSWCLGAGQCDDIMISECEYSYTTVSGNVIHAMLVPGICNDFYQRFLLAGRPSLLTTNSWILLDDMINSYCIHSATSLGDTTSCACIQSKAGSIIYSSCSVFGETCLDSGIRPVQSVNSASNDTIAISDYVCSNPNCIKAMTGQTFITSGLIERAYTCPTQVCLQMNLGKSITVGTITADSIYIDDTSLICTAHTVSDLAPDILLTPLQTIWFTNSSGYTNPNSVQAVVFTNESTITANYTISYDPLPPFVNNITLNNSGVLNPGHTSEYFYGLVKGYGPTNTSIGFTFTVPGLIQFTTTVPFSIVNTDIPIIPPIIPLSKYNYSLTTGGKSLVIISITLFLFTLFLVIRHLSFLSSKGF